MPADFLDLAGRDVLVMGVANRKSVAWHVAQVLTGAGARVIYAVRSDERARAVRELAGDDAIVIACDVERPEEIDVKAMDENGEPVAFRCGGLLARAIQHEWDHLQGILFVDRLTPADKIRLGSKLQEMEQAYSSRT